MRIIDLTGKRFGKLLVIQRAGHRGNLVTWLCRCDCGIEKEITGRELRTGDAKTCRIRSRHSKLGYGEAAFNAVYAYTRFQAIKRGYEWGLSKEQVKDITQKDCFYCGCHPKQVMKSEPKGCVGDYIYNGIDRVDNAVGYIPNNCVPCCGQCNRNKTDMTIDEFRSYIISIYNHWILPNS